VAPFEKARTQVDIKKVQGCPARVNVSLQTATLLASWYSDVVVIDRAQRKTTEQEIAVPAAIQAPIFAHASVKA
jgi:hypothetical protein